MYNYVSVHCTQVGLNGLFSKYGTVERLSVREKEYYQTAYVVGRSKSLLWNEKRADIHTKYFTVMYSI